VFHLSLILGALGKLGMALDLLESIHAAEAALGADVAHAKLF
jgi:hypothetical protein